MEAMERQRAVLRFLDARVVKGYLQSFSPTDTTVEVDEDGTSRTVQAAVSELKAIFFVKTFEGDSAYAEKKSFRGKPFRGKKAYVRFKDGESMIGYIEGGTAWERGFFLDGKKGTGFFLLPTDEDCNNIRTFVVTSAIDDVTVVG
jgi:hypothetical protein